MQRVAEFEIGDILPIALTFVVVGIAISYGLDVQSDVKTDVATSNTCPTYGGSPVVNVSKPTLCYNSTGGVKNAKLSSEYNASVDSMTSVSNIAKKLPTIATVVVAAIVIGILIRYMVVRAE